MKTYKMNEIKEIHIYGRDAGKRDSLHLFWTASGFEVNVRASEMWIEVEADYQVYEPWISVLMDHAPISRQMVTKGRFWIPVFRNLDADTTRTVRILRDVQAMSADPGSFLKIHAVRLEGSFEEITKKDLRIEFVGDSITSGEGTLGDKNEMDWVSMVFSGVHNYATMTAEKLNADYRIVSQSGWGVLSSWDGNPVCNVPRYYEQVCGLTAEGENKADGADQKYDFTSWQADVVVVNLGTNDASAFEQPAIYKDDAGVLFEQKRKEDGSLEEASKRRLQQAIVDFIKTIRRNNERAHILWAYGMLGAPIRDLIAEAVEFYQREYKDDRVSFVALTAATVDTIGSREHPGAVCHRQASEKLTAEIKKLIKS